MKSHLEKKWPIDEELKDLEAESFFDWVGICIAEVVQNGREAWPGELPAELPLGITFSFPMMFVSAFRTPH